MNHSRSRCMVTMFAVFLCLFMRFALSAGAEEGILDPEGKKAVGVVIVNAEELPIKGDRVYAEIDDDGVRYDFDAAFLYYVVEDTESGYAGQQLFSRLSFWADCDTNQIGAEGVVSFHRQARRKNEVIAFYLYADEQGIYFDPYKPFARMVGGEVLRGVDFPCTVLIDIVEPVKRFTLIFFDQAGKSLSGGKFYDEADVSDEQEILLPDGTAAVELIGYNANGSEIKRERMTSEDKNPYVCVESKGQLLYSKTLDLRWE